MVDSIVMQSGRYKAYPEYKDSGVEWLGEIPSHWQVKRLGQFFKERREKVSDKDYPPLSVTMKGIVPQLENAAKSDAGDNRKLVLKNDFVINSRSDRKGSSGISSLDGSVSLISIVLEPKGISPRYAHHLLRSYNFQEEFYRHGKGIVADLWSTNSSEMKDILIPEISENESNAIASFLDYETAKIDTLIEKQQRLIELLTEKRQAVISHAVTKGLNPDVPMKDSGVEWLDEVPEHWEVKRFKTIFKIRKRIAGELGHDVLSITQKGIKIKDTESGEGQLSMDYSKYQLVYKGDYAMNHMDLLTGFVDISKYDGVTSPDYRVFTLEEKNSLPEYFLAFLQMGYINKLFFPFGQGAAHMGRWRLPTEAFREFLAPVPPKNEQKAIADFIFNSLEQMDILEKKSRKAIKLMQERRTALISAAVTGKIDVRDWVKPE